MVRAYKSGNTSISFTKSRFYPNDEVDETELFSIHSFRYQNQAAFVAGQIDLQAYMTI
jgi:hypothetical protein